MEGPVIVADLEKRKGSRGLGHGWRPGAKGKGARRGREESACVRYSFAC